MRVFSLVTARALVKTLRRRASTLALIVALHLGAIFFWPRSGAPDAESASRQTDVVFVKQLERPTVAPAPGPQRPKQRRERISPPVQRETTVVAIPRQATVPAVEPDPVVARSYDDMISQARQDVGKIDRELRKSSLNLAERTTVLQPGQRERLIAGAFVGGGPPPIIEDVLADGRLRSRRGGMCASKESNGLVGGRDVFSGGIKTKWEQCPK